MADYGVYCPYETLKSYIGIDTADDKDDELLRAICTGASRMFDNATLRTFYPELATRYYDMPTHCSDRLDLDRDLLAVTTFTTQNDDVTLTTTHYYPMSGDSYDDTPFDRLQMREESAYPTLLWDDTRRKSQKVIGTWGWHDDWANAWRTSGDEVEDNPLSAVATTVTVNDVNGADAVGIRPRFKVQDLLKIESEYIYVTAKDPVANTMTVVRGANGTTAAAHVLNTAITVYQPPVNVHLAVRELAKWLYDRKDTSAADQIAAIGISGLVKIPSNAPSVVSAAIAYHMRRGVH